MKGIIRLPSLQLERTVAWRDMSTELMYERCCRGEIQGQACPVSLREATPLDPPCSACGAAILGQSELAWGRELLQREQKLHSLNSSQEQ